MLTYLHDIRNKLTLISGQTMILSKKYGEEDFLPIRANLVRISELINDAYRHLKEDKEEKKIPFTPSEFVRQMDLLTDTMSLLFPLDIKNETRAYSPGEHVYNVEFNIGQIFQVIENAIDNSVKAHAKKIIVRILEVKDHCIYEIVDNGTGKSVQQVFSEDFAIEGQSIIPHGIGKEIMIENMKAIGGKIEWTRRLDYSGMIVRLYFPKKGQSAILA